MRLGRSSSTRYMYLYFTYLYTLHTFILYFTCIMLYRPVHMYCSFLFLHTVSLFFSLPLSLQGADVNAAPVPSSRDTALTIAADKGHYRFVKLLLRHAASVDVKNKKRNSPLWLASNGMHMWSILVRVFARFFWKGVVHLVCS